MLKIVKDLPEGLMLLNADVAVQAGSGLVEDHDASPLDQGISILRKIAKNNIHPVAYQGAGKSNITPLYDSRDLEIPAENLVKLKNVYKVVRKTLSESLLIDSKTAIKAGSIFVSDDASPIDQKIELDNNLRTKRVVPHIYEQAGSKTISLYNAPDIGVKADNVG